MENDDYKIDTVRPLAEWQTYMANQIRTLNERMERHEQQLETNTKTTQEVLNIMTLAKSGFRVLGGLGVIAKWITTLGSAAAIIWAVFSYGVNNIKPPGH